jgi:hypothetical protein
LHSNVALADVERSSKTGAASAVSPSGPLTIPVWGPVVKIVKVRFARVPSLPAVSVARTLNV